MGRKALAQLVFAAVSAAFVATPGGAWGQTAPCPAQAVNGSVSSGCGLAVNGATASGNGVAIGDPEPAEAATPTTVASAQAVGGSGAAAATAAPSPAALPALAGVATGVPAAPPALAGVATGVPTPLIQIPEATGPALPSTAPVVAPPAPAAAVQVVPQATGAVGSQPATSSGALVLTGGHPGGLLRVAGLALVGGAALVVLAGRRQRRIGA